MILVVGGLADTVTELVCARLSVRGYPYRLLDLRRYPMDYRISARWCEGLPDGVIEGPDWRLRLAQISGTYVRYLPRDCRFPSGNPAESVEPLTAEADAGLMTLLESLPCPVVNRTAGGMSNNSKPYQALILRRVGLRVPPTLVTNEPEAVRAFLAQHHDVVYKSASSVRSIVRRLGPPMVERLGRLHNGPAQFQAYVPGDNVRVHTVGERIFAVRVKSEAVDYRYAHRDGLAVTMEPITLPADIEHACRMAASEMNLLLAGIDLKVTPDGDWYCFEVNPSPGFLYYERHSGLPISAALADLLHRGEAA